MMTRFDANSTGGKTYIPHGMFKCNDCAFLEIASLRAALAEKEKEAQGLRERIAELEKDPAKRQKDINDLVILNAKSRERAEAAERAAQALREELAELKTPLKDWDKKLAEKNTALSKRNAELAASDQEIKTLREELERWKPYTSRLYDEIVHHIKHKWKIRSKLRAKDSLLAEQAAQIRSMTGKIYSSEDLADAMALAKPGRLLPLDNEGNLSSQGVTVLIHSICTLAKNVAEQAAVIERAREALRKLCMGDCEEPCKCFACVALAALPTPRTAPEAKPCRCNAVKTPCDSCEDASYPPDDAAPAPEKP